MITQVHLQTDQSSFWFIGSKKNNLGEKLYYEDFTILMSLGLSNDLNLEKTPILLFAVVRHISFLR